MSYDAKLTELPDREHSAEEDLSFVAFSLAHAACGDDVLEVRLGEQVLLEWCTACAVLKIFGPGEA